MSESVDQVVEAKGEGNQAVLQLTVRNHPGVMSHVCGLFSRRAYNVEGILCIPVGAGQTSHIWLMVSESDRLEQVIRHLEKLVDVLKVERHEASHEVFLGLEGFFRAPAPEREE